MDALVTGALDLLEPMRLALLVGGVLLGLIIGVIPGVGGIFGLVLIIPLTYSLDPVSAFAVLLGMASVTTTSDTIPAVLIGVPGTIGAAATVVDGHELAKQGQAARAFGAAYSASLIGGIFGALVLALSLPIMRPLVLTLNYGDLLAVTILGLALVATVSEKSPAKGVLAAMVGALIAYTGLDPQEGVERWTLGQVYLWDGVPTAVMFLGLFGLPELAALLARGQIADASARSEPGGLRRGMIDTLQNWKLVLRSSSLGALLGAVPGVGVVVIEWFAYGDAARSTKGGVTFGQGNIRGVIAPESANNAKEGGSLIPTLAFGIPGSASMSILLGAFMIHGIVPGPEMLTTQAPLLMSMVLIIAAANALGAGICLIGTRHLARLAQVPGTSLVPVALCFVVLGAFQTNHDRLDLLTLLVFGCLGVLMKRANWSRPAFALGFVLAPNLERFFYLTYQISGWGWLTQPVVGVILAVTLFLIVRSFLKWRVRPEPVIATRPDWVTLAVFGVLVLGAATISWQLPTAAGLFPGIVASLACALVLVMAALMWRARRAVTGQIPTPTMRHDVELIALTLVACLALLALGPMAGCVAFLGICAQHFRKPSVIATLATAGIIAIVIYVVFYVLTPTPWPKPWIANLAT